ncbi:hypothetical protein [Microbulbifer litoralis]|nr:hypothetical protein [Microbulbifer sp. GX H0434]
MKTVISIVNRSVRDYGRPAQAAECNYSDNYYGDQVCVLRRSA